MPYRLSKSRRILKQGVKLYKRREKHLSDSNRAAFAKALEDLDASLLAKDRVGSDKYAHIVDDFIKVHFPKTFLDHTLELVSALAFAIVCAFLIRQFWFELYEVPTGSMRPTIKELDRLVVSKTTFGINLPFQKGLILSRDDYIKRLGCVVFTVEGMDDVIDSNTTYFYLFPGKKRFVKRCMGKPGDTLYFYGGKIYGIDADGKPIGPLEIGKIDHVPYITMEGRVSLSDAFSQGVFGTTLIRQMDIPVGKIELQTKEQSIGTFFNGKEWIKEDINALKKPHSKPVSYSDLWGIGNYAMARLLNKREVEHFYGASAVPSKESSLYLELRHTPNFTYPHPEIRLGETGKVQPMITPFVALIPLQEKHLDALFAALYTARFTINDGHAYRYQEGGSRPQPADYDPLFPGVPNGTYEFYYGKGYEVRLFGITRSLPLGHPLYTHTPENLQKLFNLGIGFNLVYQPMASNQTFNPQRFAYYRDGDLYVMGAPIFKKEDPILRTFVAKEMEKQHASKANSPYIAFVDRGPPPSVEFIKAFGLKVPNTAFLALGDNYAMSADSRDFGFVPVSKLRGAPSFTFWPPSNRLGPLPQTPYPWFTVPNVLIWSIVALIAISSYLVIRRRRSRLYFKR